MHIDITDSPETTSEKINNYASAAFLFGAAIFCCGVGVGIIEKELRDFRNLTRSFSNPKPLPKRKASPEANAGPAQVVKNILDELMKRKGHSAMPTSENIKEVVQKIDPAIDEHSTVATRKVSEVDTFYYVKKSYKEAVVAGSLIPKDFLVEKSDSLANHTYNSMDNKKFRSRVTHEVHGGMTLVEVEEIVNKLPLKPV